jgi:hypothetical protein
MNNAMYKRGDRFVWTSRHSHWPVYIEVIRVARDGTWVDIACQTWAAAWSKRQRLPLPQRTERRSWTRDDVDRDVAEALADSA